MIRATTNGVLRSFRADLMNSFITLNSSRDTVLTQRNFNTYAEDPAAAAQCFQLRRAYQRTDAQLTISNSTSRKFDSAYSCLTSVVNMVDNEQQTSSWASTLTSLNDTTGSGRAALGQQMTQLAESIVQTMNSKYGDNYLFAGADGLNVPFTWSSDENGLTLCYRGIDVDSYVPKVQTDANGNPVVDAATGDYLLADGSGTISVADYEAAEAEFAKLEYLSGEARYVDIGIGLQEMLSGELIESSAFNDALQGINFLGYGSDENGDSNNIVSIIHRMGTILQRCNEEDGSWSSDEDQAEMLRLANKFDDIAAGLKRAHVDLSTEADFLNNNAAQLENTAYTLNEQILEIEQCNLAEAITNFSWAQYCYNAALKMGNSILSESLMDYLTF